MTDTVPPHLNSLPLELHHLIFEWLPAEDAYFARFLSRNLRVAGVNRVDKALAEMVAKKDPDGVSDFLDACFRLFKARTGRDPGQTVKSLGGLLLRAGLEPGAVWYKILADYYQRRASATSGEATFFVVSNSLWSFSPPSTRTTNARTTTSA